MSATYWVPVQTDILGDVLTGPSPHGITWTGDTRPSQHHGCRDLEAIDTDAPAELDGLTVELHLQQTPDGITVTSRTVLA